MNFSLYIKSKLNLINVILIYSKIINNYYLNSLILLNSLKLINLLSFIFYINIRKGFVFRGRINIINVKLKTTISSANKI